MPQPPWEKATVLQDMEGAMDIEFAREQEFRKGKGKSRAKFDAKRRKTMRVGRLKIKAANKGVLLSDLAAKVADSRSRSRGLKKAILKKVPVVGAAVGAADLYSRIKGKNGR